MPMPMLENGKLLAKGQVFDRELTLASHRRAQRTENNRQPLENASRLAAQLKKSQLNQCS
jgi:hypothetical protein